MQAISIDKTLQKKSGWLSISSDNKKIIAQGKTLQELIKKLKKMGNPKGSISPIPKDYTSYIG